MSGLQPPAACSVDRLGVAVCSLLAEKRRIGSSQCRLIKKFAGVVNVNLIRFVSFHQLVR